MLHKYEPNVRDGAVFRHPSSLTVQFESKNNPLQREQPLPSSVHPPLQLLLLFAPRSCSRANHTQGANFLGSPPLLKLLSWLHSPPLSTSVPCFQGLPWLILCLQATCYPMRASLLMRPSWFHILSAHLSLPRWPTLRRRCRRPPWKRKMR